MTNGTRVPTAVVFLQLFLAGLQVAVRIMGAGREEEEIADIIVTRITTTIIMDMIMVARLGAWVCTLIVDRVGRRRSLPTNGITTSTASQFIQRQ